MTSLSQPPGKAVTRSDELRLFRWAMSLGMTPMQARVFLFLMGADQARRDDIMGHLYLYRSDEPSWRIIKTFVYYVRQALSAVGVVIETTKDRAWRIPAAMKSRVLVLAENAA